jgi:NDP-sugar pyrophosphorylase family protein
MQAIVLAGGKGERLRPYTNDRPKCMVEILGIPILGYQMQWLRANNVRDVYISCGYLHEVIEDYFADGGRWGLNIRYVVEDEPLGRGGGIKKAMQALEDDQGPVIAANGDIITTADLASMVAQHKQKDALATILLTPFFSQYGIVEVSEDDHVIGFREKPELPYWINAGVYVLSREVEEMLPDKGDHEDTTFPRLAEMRRFASYRSRAFWRGVDTVKDLSEMSKEMERRLFVSLADSVQSGK